MLLLVSFQSAIDQVQKNNLEVILNMTVQSIVFIIMKDFIDKDFESMMKGISNFIN